MRLIYKQYTNRNEFAVSTDSNLSKEQGDHVICAFRENHNAEMERYIEIQNQRHTIEQEMKQILLTLKDDFKEFALDEFPELAL